MTRRSRLAVPGGFVPAAALASTIELEDLACAFCGNYDELPWLHLASSQLVCRGCLRDPWAAGRTSEEGEAGREGDAGRQAAERLLEEQVFIY